MERISACRALRLGLLFLLICVLLAASALVASAEDDGPALALSLSSDRAVYGDAFVATATLSGAEAGTEITFELGSLTATLPTDAKGRAVWEIPALTLAAQKEYICRVSCGTLAAQQTVTVTPRPLTVEGFAVKDRPYDGTKIAEISSVGSLMGLLPEDVARVSLDTSAVYCVFSNANVGENIRVTVIGFNVSGAAKNNYTVIDPTDVTASITRRVISIKGLEALPYTYDGIADREVDFAQGYALSGIVAGEEDAVLLNGLRATVAAPDANGAQSVVFDPAVTYLVGDLAQNYELVLPLDVTVEIRPAVLTLSVEKVVINKGQQIPALVAKVSGFVNGESADALAGFGLPAVVPAAVNTLDAALTAFTVSYEGGDPTDNYVFDRDSFAAVALEIRRTEADADDYTLSVGDLSKWYNAAVTVTPAGDYVGITTDKTDGSLPLDGVAFGDLLTLNDQGECTVRFALRRADGTVTEEVTLSYKLDTVAPTGDVTWRGQSIVAAATPAYRYFSREAILLSFTAQDGEQSSGVAAVEYAMSESGPFVPIAEGAATVAEAAGCYCVWYRITDGAGNTTVLCTDGLVLYRDTVAVEQALSYQRLSDTDRTLAVDWNGNTVAAIRYGEGEPLDEALYASFAEGLVLKADYLSALPAGMHTLTVTVDPMGKPFVQLSVNDAPAALTLTVTVTRRTPTVEDFTMLPLEGATYDGGEKTVTVLAPIGMGTVTVYYVDGEGNRLDVIKNAGTYAVKIDTALGADYESAAALTLGSVTVTKMTPAAPQLTYDAVTGLLSGDTAGLLYALDGGQYLPLPESFLQIVTRACTLYFYLPGDGVNTENSEVAVITVTRASQPVAVAVNETLFAACDGKIYTTVGGLEYRHVNEAGWRAVSGTAITDLAPGSYEVRVAACGTVLESAAVTVEITAAPEFIFLQKEAFADGQPAVSLRGDMTARAELLQIALSADPEASSALRSLSVIDQRTTEIIGFFDLTLNGRHNGALSLEILVGDAYNGSTLDLYYEDASGAVQSLSLPCESGRIALTLEAPSPILITTPMTTPHGVGSTAWIYVLVALLALAIVIVLWVEIACRKKKKRKA